MCINANTKRAKRLRPQGAFTLVEVLVATAVITLMLVGLFGGISYGFVETELSRENLRATQIILEKMEGIRLYTFDQLTSSNMVPATFTAAYYPIASSNQPANFTYTGTFTISDPGLSAEYNPDIRLVTVSVSWRSANGKGAVRRQREMRTMVSRYGIQNYSFFN